MKISPLSFTTSSRPGSPPTPERAPKDEVLLGQSSLSTTIKGPWSFGPQKPVFSSAEAARQASLIREGAAFTREQAFQIMDRFAAARDPVTGLIPVHVQTQEGRLVATDRIFSGLDWGRQTAGLVMASKVARAQGDANRAEAYLAEARANYEAGKDQLREGDRFVQRREFNPDGSVKSTEIGEPNRSEPGRDEVTRFNPRAYACRAAAELYLATSEPQYKADFERFFQAVVKDFHDPGKGFFVHSNINRPGDHTTRASFMGPGGQTTSFDGTGGTKGNDSTIYALSGLLLIANEVLGTEQTQTLVKESMDILLDRFQRVGHMLWENYDADFRPISEGWQNQPRQNGTNSHVAIGGHTAMAPQQILEGARQLKAQGVIDQAQYQRYVDRAVELFQDFAAKSGAVDWETGAVHNAMRVEDPEVGQRWLSNWGDAGWQQLELLQTQVQLQREGRLHEIQGPNGKNGTDLLQASLNYAKANYAFPADFSFQGYFGVPEPYHGPQAALYFQEAMGA